MPGAAIVQTHAGAFQVQRPGDRAPRFVVTASTRPVVVKVDLNAFVVLASDDVDNATDRVGAVDRGSAIQDHLDALHHRQGNLGDVGHAAEESVVAGAFPVNQDEGRLAPQSAQIYGGCASEISDVIEVAAE